MRIATPLLLIITLLFNSCQLESKKEQQIAKIKIHFDFIPFHRDFFNATPNTISNLKKKYPYLFPSHISDNEWMAKIEKSDERKLYEKVDSLYINLKDLNSELTELYRHVKFYKPDFKEPKTFTLINNLDYENSIVYADSLAFISLDMYLGASSEVYESFPKYLSQNYTYKNITIDLAQQIIERIYKIPQNRGLLESMVFHGKKLYLNQCFNPNKSENLIVGINEKKLRWTYQNEEDIWKYFVTNELLFRTDNSLKKRFINAAPFSKFYLDSDKESPGKIGTIIGLHIVQSYMKNNTLSLDIMLNKSGEEILNKSKYKPRN